MLAVLVSQINDLQLAEDMLQEALITALLHWQQNSIPDNPRAWLLRTARNRAIDQFRRISNFRIKQSEITLLQELQQVESEIEVDSAIPDERLRLIFTCCHPLLERPAQIALTLRTLCGLRTAELARAFLIPEPTMAQRLVRAKKKIRDAAIPYATPDKAQLAERLDSVLSVIYLIFNEGYSSTNHQDSIRGDLCDEALYLGEALLALLPAEPEVAGLNALLHLHDARREARYGRAGELLMLDEQDRGKWTRSKIDSGLRLLGRALHSGRVGAYTLQAAISAEHAKAATSADTSWRAIAALYAHLYSLNPTAVVRLNHAVALSFADSAAAGLDAMPQANEDNELAGYQPYHAALADMHLRNGDTVAANAHFERAIALSGNVREKAFLQKKLHALTQSPN